jgi:hypothetical protein
VIVDLGDQEVTTRLAVGHRLAGGVVDGGDVVGVEGVPYAGGVGDDAAGLYCWEDRNNGNGRS